MLINLINALMSGKRLPYDAEVEYLETDGSAYINTGAKIYNDTSVVVVWYSNYSTSTASYFFGSDSSTDRFYFREYNGNASYSIGSWWLNTNISTVGTHTIEMSNNGISVDGTASSRTGAAKTGDGNFCLFHVAAGNSPSGMRCYSCKIYQNGVLVRDYIPVRVGTEGAMYDRVSGQLFRNAGTGDFVLGPDKN